MAELNEVEQGISDLLDRNLALTARVAVLEAALRNSRQYVQWAIIDCAKDRERLAGPLVIAEESLAQIAAALNAGEQQ